MEIPHSFSLLVLLFCLAQSYAISSVQESNTSPSNFVSCSDNGTTFQCVKDERCIPLASKCDGIFDCEDNTDELQCYKKCDSHQFQCADGHCIDMAWHCDGHNDCMDEEDSDEKNCPEPPTVLCSPDQFKCSNNLCIQRSWTCDGEPDCLVTDENGVAEDENPALCGGKEEAPTCPEFQCSNGQCTLHVWVCDGEADCDDGSDEDQALCGKERNGTEACELSRGLFPCQDGSMCLEPGHVCDGINQCRDKSDEGAWCGGRNCSALACDTGCIMSQEGPQCFCKPGYKVDTDNVTCVDVDECSEWGACSQLCSNTEGSHTCTCRPGYIINNGSCVTEKEEPILFFATMHDIRAMSIHSRIYTQVEHNLPNAVGVAFDHKDRRVYWTDAQGGKETIMSKKINSYEPEHLVVKGLDMPEQLAIDEYNKNLYFTESHLGLLGVCSTGGQGCRVLVSDLEQPRGVAIHHKSRQVFFSDWGSSPFIGRLGLDGSNYTRFVDTGLVWPNGLAVDQDTDRLYWADSKLDVIESIKIDGSDRRAILTTRSIHPYSLAVFEDTIYWSDWDSFEIFSCNKFNGKDFQVIVKEAGIRPMGIAVAHPILLEPDIPAPCSGHDCSHLCLPASLPSTDFTCACPADMILDSDNKSCIADPEASRLLVASSKTIFTTNPRVMGKLDLDFTASIDPSRIEHVSALGDVHTMFLSSNGPAHGAISALDTRSGDIKRIINSNMIGSIAYDPRTTNLYWVDKHKSAVMVHSMKTGNTMELLISADVPQCLLFVPELNRLLIAHLGYLAILYTPDEMHNSVETVQHSFGYVTSMVYSPVHDSVFIGDIKNKEILKLEMTNKTIEPFKTGLHQGVISLAVQDDHLFWIEQFGSNLLWVNVNNTKDLSWQDLGSLTGKEEHLLISSFKSAMTPASSLCLSAGCSHICLNLDNEEGFVCRCPYEMALDPATNLTCIAPPRCKLETDFHCNSPNGGLECIPGSWVCDGASDCENGADEENCSPANSGRDGRVEETTAVTTSTTTTSTTSSSTTAPTTAAPQVPHLFTEAVTETSFEAAPTTDLTTVEPTVVTSSAFDSWEEVADPSDSSQEGAVTVDMTPTKPKKNGYVALAVILALVGVVIIVVCFMKCRRHKKSEFSLSFTNQTFNRASPANANTAPRIEQPDQELNAVTIVKRGNTVGYDNPGFESPWTSAFSKRAPKLSTLDWPDSPNIGHRDGIVCEGSSTPTRSMLKPLDTDSAFQEPSIAASSYNDRNFSLDDEDVDSPYCDRDNKRLL